jgi:hypothetical protein
MNDYNWKNTSNNSQFSIVNRINSIQTQFKNSLFVYQPGPGIFEPYENFTRYEQEAPSQGIWDAEISMQGCEGTNDGYLSCNSSYDLINNSSLGIYFKSDFDEYFFGVNKDSSFLKNGTLSNIGSNVLLGDTIEQVHKMTVHFDSTTNKDSAVVTFNVSNAISGNHVRTITIPNGTKISIGIFVMASQNYLKIESDNIVAEFDYFKFTGLGDLDLLAKETSKTFATGRSGIMGGTGALKRYIWVDYGSQILTNGLKNYKSLWRAQGAVLSINDALPEDVFTGSINGIIPENNSLFEDWLEGGGKFVQLSGAIPFYWVSTDTGLANNGYMGHQKIYDITDKNEDGRSFKYGLYYDSSDETNPNVITNKTNEDIDVTYNSVNSPFNEVSVISQTGLGNNNHELLRYQFARQDFNGTLNNPSIKNYGTLNLIEMSTQQEEAYLVQSNQFVPADFNASFKDNKILTPNINDYVHIPITNYHTENGYTIEMTVKNTSILSNVDLVHIFGYMAVELTTSKTVNVTIAGQSFPSLNAFNVNNIPGSANYNNPFTVDHIGIAIMYGATTQTTVITGRNTSNEIEYYDYIQTQGNFSYLNINDYINLRNVTEFVLSDYEKMFVKEHDFSEDIYGYKWDFTDTLGDWKTAGDVNVPENLLALDGQGHAKMSSQNPNGANINDGLVINLFKPLKLSEYQKMKITMSTSVTQPIKVVLSDGVFSESSDYYNTSVTYSSYIFDWSASNLAPVTSIQILFVDSSLNNIELRIDDLSFMTNRPIKIEENDLNKSIVEMNVTKDQIVNNTLINYSTQNNLVPELSIFNNSYDRHTVIKKTDYDLLEVQDIVNDKGLVAVLNSNGERSKERAQLTENNMLSGNYSVVDTNGYAKDIFTSPSEIGLYSQTIMADETGRIDYINCPYSSQVRNYLYKDSIGHYSPSDSAYYYIKEMKGTYYQTIAQVPSDFQTSIFDNSLFNSCGQYSATLDAHDRYFYYERHSERIIPGQSIIQGGISAKGLIATLPLFDWNKKDIDKSFYTELFIQEGLNILLTTQLTGEVRGNSNEEFGNYLYSLTKSLPLGDQYTSNDKTARFMVRVPTNTNHSNIDVTDTRVLEGLSNETKINQTESLGSKDYNTNTITTYGPQIWIPEYEHYPLYTLSGNGEFDRQGVGITQQLTYDTINNKRIPVLDIKDPRHDNYSSSGFRPYYISVEFPVLYYKLNDQSSPFKSIKQSKDGLPIIPSLNSLVKNVDMGDNLVINISEFDNKNDQINREEYQRVTNSWESKMLKTESNIQNYFKSNQQCQNLTDSINYYCGVDSSTGIIGDTYHEISSEINQGSYSNGVLPIQILTLENINLFGKTGDTFSSIILTGNGGQYIDKISLQGTTKAYATGLTKSIPTTNNSKHYIWSNWDKGNNHVVEYLKYIYNSTMFNSQSPIISLRNGVDQGDPTISHLGMNLELQKTHAKITIDPRKSFNWYNSEESARTISYQSNEKSINSLMSNDTYRDTNDDSIGNWNPNYSRWSKNGGSNGIAKAIFVFNTDEEESNNRNRITQMGFSKNIIFTTALSSRIEREVQSISQPQDLMLADVVKQELDQMLLFMQQIYIAISWLALSFIFMGLFMGLTGAILVNAVRLSLLQVVFISAILFTTVAVATDVFVNKIDPTTDILDYTFNHITVYLIIGAILGVIIYYASNALQVYKKIKKISEIYNQAGWGLSKTGLQMASYAEESTKVYRLGYTLSKLGKSFNFYGRHILYNLVGNVMYNYLPPVLGQAAAGLMESIFLQRNVLRYFTDSKAVFVILALSVIMGFEMVGVKTTYQKLEYYDFLRFLAKDFANRPYNKSDVLSTILTLTAVGAAVTLDADYFSFRILTAPLLQYGIENRINFFQNSLDHREILLQQNYKDMNVYNALWAEYGLIRAPGDKHTWVQNSQVGS